MNIQYNITYHAIERLQERFGAFCSEIPILKNWKRAQGLSHLKPLFNQMLDFSEENKSYLNNSSYMISLYEKYGYDTEYCFLELKEKNILFLLTKARSSKEYMLVTLMPMEYRPGVKNIKYGGKEDKKISFNKFLMDWSKNEMFIKPQNNIKENNKKLQKVIQVNAPIEKPIKLIVEKPIKLIVEKPKQLIIENSKPLIIEQPIKLIDEQTQLLHKKLISSIRENLAIQIERISNSKCMYIVVFDKKEYEFTYAKTNSGAKSIEIHSINVLTNQQQENFENGFRQLYPKTYLYQSLLTLIRDNEATLVAEQENNQRIYNVQLVNNLYNVTLIENNTENPQLIIKVKNNIKLNSDSDYEELKNSGNKLDQTDNLYLKIMSAINEQNFQTIEKYSTTTSLRLTKIDDIEYEYVYIKRNNKEKDREIILIDKLALENNTLYKSNDNTDQIVSLIDNIANNTITKKMRI